MYANLMVVYLQAFILVPYPMSLHGTEFKPDFDTSPVNITAIQNTTVYLNCTVNYLGDYKVAWLNPENKVLTNKDRRIIDDIRITIEHQRTNEWNLHFRNVQHFDEGAYTCAINTDPVQTKRVYVKVLVPARIVSRGTTGDIKTLEGATVELFCNATGIPQPTVQWFRHIPRTSYEGATKEGKAVVEPGEVLFIHNISRYCGGVYECIAYNNVGKPDSHQIDVKVVFRPEIELQTRRISQVVDKETILQCIIRANPLLSSEWQRHGRRLENNRKYQIEIYDHYNEIYTKFLDLHIKSVKKEDYGNYTCVAYNNHGEDMETMLLYEMVIPTLPPTTERSSTSTALQLPTYNVYNSEENYPPPKLGSQGPSGAASSWRFNRIYLIFCFILILWKCSLL